LRRNPHLTGKKIYQNMKPILDIVRAGSRDGVRKTGSSRFPITDCNFQSVTLDGYRGGCASATRPSFRNISRHYFAHEAPYVFAGEAAFFAMIIITAAIPVLSSVHAMADFVRAIGAV